MAAIHTQTNVYVAKEAMMAYREKEPPTYLYSNLCECQIRALSFILIHRRMQRVTSAKQPVTVISTNTLRCYSASIQASRKSCNDLPSVNSNVCDGRDFGSGRSVGLASARLSPDPVVNSRPGLWQGTVLTATEPACGVVPHK